MSKTKENLKAAFAGESQARNKYTYYAEVAEREGYHYIAKVFLETAENEKQHAMDHFKMLGELGTTEDNLKAAISGEHYETVEMYPQFAKDAQEEGDMLSAALFRMIGRVEEQHRERYKKLLDMVQNGTVFKRDKPIRWKCAKCGYIHEGTEPPMKCPACKNPREYYEPDALDL